MLPSQRFSIGVIILLLQFLLRCKALLIPEPSGQYAVALSIVKLVDESRIDPYDPSHGKRNVMISLFYPVDRKQCNETCPIPYMPPITAAYYDTVVAAFGVSSNGTFESFRLQVCCKPSSKAAEDVTKFPLVLFSAGLGGSRLEYNAVAQNLASAGYAIATLDSTYDSVVVEFPDGSHVAGLNISYWCTEVVPGFCTPTSNIPPLLDVNVQDAQFVLSQLGEHSILKTLVPGAAHGFNIDQVAYLGHSFGGATAIRASMKDKRIVGAVNLDGGQFGNITDIHQPALLFGRSDPVPHNRTDDATWQDTWDHLKAWRQQIGLKNAQHRTFSDLPRLAKLAGWPVTDKLQELIGLLDGQRSFDVITTYVKAFLDFSFNGNESPLFDGPSMAFPEVIVG
jgi:dienelactone hydrolase